MSPDGREVYATFIGQNSLLIERISAVDRRRSILAEGEEPAVSQDGGLLAYVSGSSGAERLDVRDLRSGATRSIDLTHLVGPARELLDRAVAWLGDGSDIVVLPGPVAVATDTGSAVVASANSGLAPVAPAGSCSAVPQSATCLIVVHVPANGAALTARRVVIRGVSAAADALIGGDMALPHGLLLASSEGRATTVDWISLRPGNTQLIRH